MTGPAPADPMDPWRGMRARALGALSAAAHVRGALRPFVQAAAQHAAALRPSVAGVAWTALLPPLIALLFAGLLVADLERDLTRRLAEGEHVVAGLAAQEARRWSDREQPLEEDLAAFAAALPWPGAGLALVERSAAATVVAYPKTRDGRRLLSARAPLGQGTLALELSVPLQSLIDPWYHRLPRLLALLVLALAGAAAASALLIRARRRLEAAAAAQRASESRLRFAAVQAGCGDWRWDLAEDRFSVTPAFAALLGLATGFSEGMAALERRLHPSDRAALRALATTLREGHAEGMSTLRFLHAEGHYVWLRLAAMRERHTAPGLMLFGLAIDVTASHRQAEALKSSETVLKDTVAALEASRAKLREQTRYLIVLAERYAGEKKRAEAASAAKSAFLANMSHELLTPLNAIMGFSEIVKTELYGPVGDPRYRGYAEDIHQAGRELVALINDILDMTRIDAGEHGLARTMIDPALPLREAMAEVQARARDGRVGLDYEVPALAQVRADARALKQIFVNLLSNAVKFTPAGGGVRIRGAADATGVLIRIADTGIGIAPGDLPRLGQPFEQLEPQTTKRYRGQGLGFALAKSLVELHGGTLTVESTVGVGTTVSVWLPRQARGVEPFPMKSEGDQAAPRARGPEPQGASARETTAHHA